MSWKVKTLEVRKDNWAETRISESDFESDLEPNEVVFEVGRLAITSNNISYAFSGDALAYWQFFPTDEGWGRIPAMGWASVVASNHPDIKVGERVWGFFPYTNYHKILAGKVTSSSFSDVGEHRSIHAPVYCQFDKALANPLYDAPREDQDSLLRGLFMTSWLVEDFLNETDFGAESCLITSASSKTSIALAHSVKTRGKMASVGITSARNKAFCEGLGCYDQVITYDELETQLPSGAAVVVDMAGSAETLGRIHERYGDALKHSCLIGATHYSEAGSLEGLPSPKPQFFFAPTHVQTRSAELGASVLMGMLGKAYFGFRLFCDSWLKVNCAEGEHAAKDAYLAVLNGKLDASTGQLIDM